MNSFSALRPAFTGVLPVSTSRLSNALRCERRARARARTPAMTLHPHDLSWKEERDRLAVESEFISIRLNGKVDADMALLRERIQTLGQKEKQWGEICSQFLSLSILTGIPLVDHHTGEPTFRAWLMLSLSAAVPLYVVALMVHWLQSTSIAFGNALPL